jgi:hypothetical protein
MNRIYEATSLHHKFLLTADTIQQALEKATAELRRRDINDRIVTIDETDQELVI